jgi:hypothetical protein
LKRPAFAAILAILACLTTLTVCGEEKSQENKEETEPAAPAEQMKSVSEIEGNADIPSRVTSKTFPGLTYIKYSEYKKIDAQQLGEAMEILGQGGNQVDLLEYYEEQGVSSAYEASFKAVADEGDPLELRSFALGRLPERSVALVSTPKGQAEANSAMGEGDKPGPCERTS